MAHRAAVTANIKSSYWEKNAALITKRLKADS
jgi:hypothetical protein